MSNTKRKRRAYRRQPEVTKLLNRTLLAILVGGFLVALLVAVAFHDGADNQAVCATSHACVELGR